MPVIQKQLDWVRRFLYNTSLGDVPFPLTVLPISHDWPLAPRLVAPGDYVTIAGSVSTTLYQPAEGRHGLILSAAILGVGASLPSTDAFVVSIQDITSLSGVRVIRVEGLAFQDFILVGGFGIITALTYRGLDPVYVPFGQRFRIDHVSVAGGVTVRPQLWVLDLPANYPLRLP